LRRFTNLLLALEARRSKATEETAGSYGLTGGGTKLDWVSTVNFR
jgi:hypothetical protein